MKGPVFRRTRYGSSKPGVHGRVARAKDEECVSPVTAEPLGDDDLCRLEGGPIERSRDSPQRRRPGSGRDPPVIRTFWLSFQGKCAVRFAPAWLTEGPGQWEPGAGAHTRTRPAPSAAAHLDPAQPPLTPAHHHRTRPEFLSNSGGSSSSWPATTILTRSSTIVFGIVRKGVMRARAVRVKEPQHVVDALDPGREVARPGAIDELMRTLNEACLPPSFVPRHWHGPEVRSPRSSAGRYQSEWLISASNNGGAHRLARGAGKSKPASFQAGSCPISFPANRFRFR
jgi:hypothetical protein